MSFRAGFSTLRILRNAGRSALRIRGKGFTSASAATKRSISFAAGLTAAGISAAMIHKFTVEASMDAKEVGAWEKKAGKVLPGLKDISLKEVSKHNSKQAGGIWVTYQNAVYDVTEFVEVHPGGSRILMAAGGAIDKYWGMFGAHKKEDTFELLETLRIGNVAPEDRQPESAFHVDPYGSDPERSDTLVVHAKKPFNASAGAETLEQDFIQPNEKFFVRNHMPVPQVDASAWYFEISGEGIDEPIKLTLEDLHTKFEQVDVVSPVMCGGNRRLDMHQHKNVRGIMWATGAISNAKWTGVRLTDVLRHANLDISDPGVKHICFEGLDRDDKEPYGASIPADLCLDPARDIILATKMNDEILPRDHGYPVRVLAPGIVGGRNVKWLHKIIVSDEESPSFWQRQDYKLVKPDKNGKADFSKAFAIQELPVMSAIVSPQPDQTVKLEDGHMTVKGYAWSGSGRGIHKVEVSADNGKTWTEAILKVPDMPEIRGKMHTRAWHWVPFEAMMAVDPLRNPHPTVTARAIDAAHNSQPQDMEEIWNVRGLLNNAYHRVKCHIGQ